MQLHAHRSERLSPGVLQKRWTSSLVFAASPPVGPPLACAGVRVLAAAGGGGASSMLLLRSLAWASLLPPGGSWSLPSSLLARGPAGSMLLRQRSRLERVAAAAGNAQ